jgi:hypothetical protein
MPQRPRHTVTPGRPTPSASRCTRCARATRTLHQTRCFACYIYWWRHGIDRPVATGTRRQ